MREMAFFEPLHHDKSVRFLVWRPTVFDFAYIVSAAKGPA